MNSFKSNFKFKLQSARKKSNDAREKFHKIHQAIKNHDVYQSNESKVSSVKHTLLYNVMSSVTDPRLKKRIQTNMEQKYLQQRLKLKNCQEEIKMKKKKQN